jgi:hypothetical protein
VPVALVSVFISAETAKLEFSEERPPLFCTTHLLDIELPPNGTSRVRDTKGSFRLRASTRVDAKFQHTGKIFRTHTALTRRRASGRVNAEQENHCQQCKLRALMRVDARKATRVDVRSLNEP